MQAQLLHWSNRVISPATSLSQNFRLAIATSGGSAKELADLRPELIEVTTTSATVAVLLQTVTVPMVFGIVLDALGSAFVECFARPSVTQWSTSKPLSSAADCTYFS